MPPPEGRGPPPRKGGPDPLKCLARSNLDNQLKVDRGHCRRTSAFAHVYREGFEELSVELDRRELPWLVRKHHPRLAVLA
jgi:hypothetical protein